ncbi:extracellular solute-binding protein [Enterococcus sp. CSURQ0835]|uniref:extracellular solute-binding protein n=1 Tax=Enterococcus sp. CSURQ0835 TaxID=2681394 RepID=UPI00135AE430|nr:extracellular solute-binding protein [Enterococcus sp. CSURQ0835]
MNRKLKKTLAGLCLIGTLTLLGACGKSSASESHASAASDKKVVIYTNADEEPVNVIKKVLDTNGYKNKYVLQSFGTSELGGKLLAEGKHIEADLVTMSTFYLDSAQKKSQLFKPLKLAATPLTKVPDFEAPMTTQEGVIFYNTKALKEANLPVPKSLAELADSKYKGQLSISDIKHSSTAWLLFQALIEQYGENKTKTILKGIYQNAGDHIEESGSGPLKKVRVGEVALGFGLRHQAVKDKQDGLPIDYVEPTEGTYSLTESLAVVDKGKKTNPAAEKMLNLIVTKGRKELIKDYPSALYQNESTQGLEIAKDQKVFAKKLTPELLKQHAELAE